MRWTTLLGVLFSCLPLFAGAFVPAYGQSYNRTSAISESQSPSEACDAPVGVSQAALMSRLPASWLPYVQAAPDHKLSRLPAAWLPYVQVSKLPAAATAAKKHSNNADLERQAQLIVNAKQREQAALARCARDIHAQQQALARKNTSRVALTQKTLKKSDQTKNVVASKKESGTLIGALVGQSLQPAAHSASIQKGIVKKSASAKAPPKVAPIKTAVKKIAPVSAKPKSAVAPQLAAIKLSSDASARVGNDGVVELEFGDMLVDTSAELKVRMGSQLTVLSGQTIAELSNRDGCTKVRNLCDKHSVSLVSTVSDHRFVVNVGQEVVTAQSFEALKESAASDGIQRRMVNTFELADGHAVLTCEFSPTALISSNALLNQLRHTSSAKDKAIFDKVLRMAACLQVATARHGGYAPISAND